MANVMMKANLKLSGVNHSVNKVRCRLSNTLIIGADVTHPGFSTLPGTPSIAAVLGSVESTGGKFLGSMRFQYKDKQEVSTLGLRLLPNLLMNLDDRLARRLGL